MKSILDPVSSGAPKPLSRRTKGTPSDGKGAGTGLSFNHLPPGMNIGNQELAVDVKPIVALKPMGPIIL